MIFNGTYSPMITISIVRMLNFVSMMYYIMLILNCACVFVRHRVNKGAFFKIISFGFHFPFSYDTKFRSNYVHLRMVFFTISNPKTTPKHTEEWN